MLTEREKVTPLAPDDWVRRADEQLQGRPFADAGPERIIRFAALGTDWTVRSAIAYRHARAAERFAAAAQVLLVELSDDDLCLLPSRIDVTVEATTEHLALEDRVLWAASNDKSLRKVLLSTAERPEDLDAEQLNLELLYVLTTILLDVSLLPHERYFQTLDSAYKRGLTHKLAPPRPYDDLAEVVAAQRYELTPRGRARPPLTPLAFRQSNTISSPGRLDRARPSTPTQRASSSPTGTSSLASCSYKRSRACVRTTAFRPSSPRCASAAGRTGTSSRRSTTSL